MRRITICLFNLLLVITGLVRAQEIRNLGYGHKQDKLMAIEYSIQSNKIVAGTSPNGHLYSFDPTDINSVIDLGGVSSPMEVYALWTLCSDDAGYVYGGTWGDSREFATIFRYNPDDESISKFYFDEIGIENDAIICSSTNTDQYVYYGTYGKNPVARLIKFNKSQETVDNFLNPFTNDFVQTNYPPEYIDYLNSLYASGYPGETYIRSLASTVGGKIYGGTNNGFIFEFDPATNTFTDHLNIFTELGYNDKVGWVYYMRSYENILFVGVTDPESLKGTYLVDFSISPGSRVAYITSATGEMTIIANYLYVNGKRINVLDTNDIINTNFYGSRYISYTDLGEDFLAKFYSRSSDMLQTIYHFDTYKVSDGTITNSTVPGVDENERVGIYRGQWIRSVAANQVNVYGGLGFDDALYGHQIVYDFLENSVSVIGPAGAANVDAMIEYNNMIYTGLYPIMSIGIFNPIINETIDVIDYRTSSGSRQVRINCFIVDAISGMLYAGSGPSTSTTVSDENAWIVSLNTSTMDTNHVLELGSDVQGLGVDIKWIEDIEYYDNKLFVLGYNYNIHRVMIIDIDPNNPNAPEVLSGGNTEYYARNILIDSDNNKIYLSLSNNMLRIYQLSEVLANPNGFIGSNYDESAFSNGIEDIIKGNDSYVYLTYGNSIGRIDEVGDFTDFGQVTIGDKEAWCLTVSSNPNNNNVYIGGRDGNMYVLELNNNPGPYRNQEVITKIGNRWYFSEDALWLKTGAHGIFSDASQTAVGDFDGNGDDDLIIAYDNGECYLRDDPNDLFNDVQVHTGPPYVTHFAVGDFDGNYDDEVVTAFDDNNCYLSEDGLDLDYGSPVSSSNTVFKFAVGDFDGNNNDEVITAFDNGYICYLSDDGLDLMSGNPVHDYPGVAVAHFAVGDFDGDDDDEIITAFDVAECHLSEDGLDLYGGLLVHIGDFVSNFAAGDFDGDRDDEVVTAFEISGCFLSEDGTDLAGGLQVYNGTNITHFAVGDFDGDNDDDLITAFLTLYPDFLARATLSDYITDLANATQVFLSINNSINNLAVGDFGGENILCNEISDDNKGPLVPGIPYIIVCDAEVPGGQVLTVNEGATIYFSEQTRITANGLLDVTGSDSNPVYFISNDYGERGNIIVRNHFTMQNGGILTLSSQIDIDIIEGPGDDKKDDMEFIAPEESISNKSLQSQKDDSEKKNKPIIKGSGSTKK